MLIIINAQDAINTLTKPLERGSNPHTNHKVQAV